MKTLLLGLAVAAMAIPWAAHAQSGYDDYPYPPQDDRYVCQAQGCVSADPPYYDPGYEEPIYDEPAYDDGRRDARCAYGCAHYHWEEPGRPYGDEGYGYDWEAPYGGYDQGPPADGYDYGDGRY